MASKKSGISGDRAYRLQSKYKSLLLDCILFAIHSRSSQVDIRDKCRKLLSEAHTKGAPQHVVSYLHGIYDTKMDDMYKYHLVWMMSVDGKLYTSKEMHELSVKESKLKKSKLSSYMSPWGRCNTDKSMYVWLDNQGKPLLDKPFG